MLAVGALFVCFCGSRLYAQVSTGNVSDSEIQQYSQQGRQALIAGRYEDAEQAYKRLAQIDPGVAEVYAALGLAYYQERKFDQAVPALRQALKLKPGLQKTNTLLAMSLAELGHYRQALPGLEKGFRFSSDSELKRRCGLQLERTYTELKRDREAVEVAMELNRLYPKDPEVLYHTGQIYGNYAFIMMHTLGKVAPNSLWRHLAAAEAYESQGSDTLALGEYRAVLKLDPTRPGIHYRMGRTLMARSQHGTSAADTSEASKEFELELKQDPGNANAWYELGEIYRTSGRLDEAAKCFQSALQYYPDFEEANLGLASVLMMQQKPGMALPRLQKAIALNPDDEVSWYRLMRVEKSLGNVAAEKDAQTKFMQLHSQQVARQGTGQEFFSPSGVTKQKLNAATNE